MKNILLIITLFVSWNTFAEEKTWYCSTEKRAGLDYQEGAWKVLGFTPLRVTVKQQDNALSFSKYPFNRLANCNKLFQSINPEVITCNDDGTRTFTLNTNTGLATSSLAYGWITNGDKNDEHDTLTVSVWECESF